MAATNQLTVSRQPANNPSHNIQPGQRSRGWQCGGPSLSFIDGLPAASRYLVWGMEVFFIRPNFQL